MSYEPPFNDGASGNVAHAADQIARNCTASGIIRHLSCCQRVCLDETLCLRPQLGREAVPGALLLLLCERKIIVAFDIKLKVTVISLLGSSNITHLQHVPHDQSQGLASREEAGLGSCNLLPRLAKQGPEEMEGLPRTVYQA